MKKILPASKGFTLIELMVVVTIIAFLSVIGIVAFTNAQKQARDGRRRADIESIATALESNFNPATGFYAPLTDNMFAGGKQPKDPGTTSYETKLVDSNKGFWTCATLENPQGNSGGVTENAGPPFTMSLAAGTDKFCKISQQSQ